ncbi:HEPN domain-containing protein [Candidatus Woesearchaeota archaeon]|nr:HEPN domain-containing protein [Candidatus Woesearchaeota archaeon]
MPRIEEHLKWCLKDPRRLIKTKPDLELAQKHIKKSEYNYEVVQILEKLKKYDWALNVGFYSIYHCFLALLVKHGYESRNQACTITILLTLINNEKLSLDKDLITQFDTLDVEKNIINPTVRESRELSTYGVGTTIDLQQLKKIKDLIIKVQRETIRILIE